MPDDFDRRKTGTRSRRQAKTPGGPATARDPSDIDVRAFVNSIAADLPTTTYPSKRGIFRQGDPADAVYVIEKGKVRLTVVSDQGKEGVIAILGAGDFLGEGCIAGQPLYLSTASTLVTSELIRIEKARMIRMLTEQPILAQVFIGHLLMRNLQFEADLVDQLFNSSEKRLARVLLLLANFGKEGKLEHVIPRISQDVLAAKVGTTRARVNFFMNKFRKLGLIQYNGGITVHSALLNVIVHD